MGSKLDDAAIKKINDKVDDVLLDCILARIDSWDESKHPRNGDGEFGSGGGGGDSKSSSGKLTPTEKQWIDNYSGDDFLRVNSSLRSGKDPGGSMVKNLDSAIAKSSIPKGTTLYRGMSKDAAKKLFPNGEIKVGQRIKDRGYSSTSKSAAAASSWGAGGVLLKIETGKQAKGIDMEEQSRNKAEKEVLLPRDAEMIVRGVTAPKQPGDPVIVRVSYGED